MLAATSRPDLLDAALLRPGRLDRLIYCGFPTAPERAEIIKALARRLRLEGSVDLKGVGHRAEGYTGADLSALLSEAQLAAVHERLEEGTSVQDAAVQVLFVVMMAVAFCVLGEECLRTSHTCGCLSCSQWCPFVL